MKTPCGRQNPICLKGLHILVNDNDSTHLIEARVPPDSGETRLDVFLCGLADIEEAGLSRAAVQRLIKDGKVFVNDATKTKANFRVTDDDLVRLKLDRPSSGLVPEDGELDILYADADLVVLNKPAGLTVHPAAGLTKGTLVHRLLSRFPQLAEMEGERPGIVHRIDKDTSGLLVVALHEKSRLALAEAFAERQVDKRYLAVVFGMPERKDDVINAPIGRDPQHKTKMAVLPKGGRDALSEYRVLWCDNEKGTSDKQISLLEVDIHTGRTHQIRVHLAHLGHPLAGDKVYGSRLNAEWVQQHGPKAAAPRQMLHAWKIGFTHPETGEEMRFQVPPPSDMMDFLMTLTGSSLRVGVTGMPGCGKSAFLSFLEEEGVPVFSADAAVAEVYAHGADGWELLRRRFGENIAPDNADVDKKALFQAMLSSDALRREILDTVHPLVQHRLQVFYDEHPEAKVTAAEIPLLLEAGWKSAFDIVVTVHSPEDERRKRLSKGRGWSEEMISTLESWQWSAGDKRNAADEIVENDGTLEKLREQAQSFLKRAYILLDERRRQALAHFHTIFNNEE